MHIWAIERNGRNEIVGIAKLEQDLTGLWTDCRTGGYFTGNIEVEVSPIDIDPDVKGQTLMLTSRYGEKDCEPNT